MSAESPVLNALVTLVRQRLALVLDEHRRADVERALREGLASGEADTPTAALRRLEDEDIRSPLWQRIIGAAAIGETYFFRDRAQMDALRLHVLPQLIAQRRAQQWLSLRLWSAGCSTGEEPYTLAILLHELLPDLAQWHITLLATDLNTRSLERAASGLYRPWSFRTETPAGVRTRWFSDSAEGIRIDPALRRMVTFAPLNLASDDASALRTASGMDLILCRNVLIYFDAPGAARVVGRLRDALAPQGWLMLGHAEAGCALNPPLETCAFGNTVLHRRPADPPPASAQPAPQTAPPPALLAPPARSAASAPEGDALRRAEQAAGREHWQEALDWLSRAERTSARLRPELHYLRGIVALHQQRHDLAIEALRRAITCDTCFVLAHFTLGEVYAQQGDSRRAAGHWQQTRQMLAGQEPDALLPAGGDLTVEMLARLVQYRLGSQAG